MIDMEEPNENIVTVTYHSVGISVLFIYTCIKTYINTYIQFKRFFAINKEKEICLLNKEFLSDYTCKGTDMAYKHKIFVAVTSPFSHTAI